MVLATLLQWYFLVSVHLCNCKILTSIVTWSCGALSVVRFRTAVKEPFTLSFILWSVCLGISIGAEQFIFTLLILGAGTLIIYSLFWKSILPSKTKSGSYINQFTSDTMLITAHKSSTIYQAFELLGKYVISFNVKSISSSSEITSATINVNIDDTKNQGVMNVLQEQTDVKSISFYNSSNE